MRKYILPIILAILLILSLFLNGYQYYSYSHQIPVIQTDTITIVKDSIIYKDKIKFVTYYDTIIETSTDTLFLEIPIEHHQYKDTISKDSITYNLDIRYSGFKASLDTIQISTLYTPSIVTKKKRLSSGLNLGIQVGYGMGFTPMPVPAPYIGIGLSYGLNINL